MRLLILSLIAALTVGAASTKDYSLEGLSGLQDAHQLAVHAESLHVDKRLVWGIAWQESRDGSKGNKVLGMGITRLLKTSCYMWDGATGKCLQYNEHLVRTCREIGRMQLNPCVNWTQLLHDQRCTLQRIKASYDDNVHCGIKNMKRLAKEKGWTYVPSWYNGGNASYQKDVETYLGHLTLKALK